MMSTTAWTLGLAGGLALLTWWMWRVNRRAFVVAAIHNGVWALALVMLSTGLIAYDPSSAAAWATVAVGLLAFNAGVAAIALVRPKRSAATAPEVPSGPRDEAAPGRGAAALMGRRTFLVLAALYVAAFVAYLWVQTARVGFNVLISDPARIRDFQGQSNLESTPLAIRIFFDLAPILFAALAYRPAIDRPFPLVGRLLGLTVIAASMLALLQRTNVFLAVLLWISLVIFGWAGPSRDAGRRRRSTWARASIVVIAGGALLLGSFQLIGTTLGKGDIQAISSGRVAPALQGSGLTAAFVYATAGVPAFTHLVDSTNPDLPPASADHIVSGDYNPVLWGAAQFQLVARYLPGVPDWSPIEPFIDCGIATNVYTWMGPSYRDFRVPGLAIEMFLIGFVIAGLYRFRWRSPRFFWLGALGMSALFLVTFASPTQWASLEIFTIVLLLALTSPRISRVLSRSISRRVSRPGADR